LSMTCGATEILSEYYVMEKVLPLLTEAQSYTVNGQEVKAIKVDNKVSIVANNVENIGADIIAKEKIQIGARENLVIGSLEAIDKKVNDG
ncbi:hypothetical protein ACW0TR_01145, partial [Fusobacterium polymorphum]